MYCIHSLEAERGRLKLHSLSLPGLVQDPTPWDAAAHFRLGLPSSVKSFWSIPRRHSCLFLNTIILNTIKLIIKIEHYNAYVCFSLRYGTLCISWPFILNFCVKT